MVGINELPPELACPILETLIVDDIFNIRLASRSFSAWIDYYIPAIAYRVARNTFPRARLLLRPTYEGIYDLAWLRMLIPRRLASIALDKDSMRAYNPTNSVRYRIPAEDDVGDQLRKRVTRAWCLLRRISLIYQEAYALPHDTNASPSAREDLVYERVLSHIASLEPHECESFFILAYVLLSAFHDENCRLRRWRYYLKNSLYKESDGFCFFDCRAQHVPRPKPESELEPAAEICEEPRHPDKGNSWVWYWLFREGAGAFWEQWGLGALCRKEDQANNHVGLRLQDAWRQQSETQVHIERETAARIWYALMARSKATESPQSLRPPEGYGSLMNASNDVLPMLDQWYAEKDNQSSGAIGKTMLEWYLWQEGIIAIDEEWAEGHISRDEIAHLREKSDKLDSLRDVPYMVCFKTIT